MATVLSSNFRHLLFWRAAEGLGETFYYPASMSLISDYHGRRHALARDGAAPDRASTSGTIGGGFFAGLIGQHYGWRLSFIVFGGLGVLLGLVLNRLLVEPVRGAAELDARSGRCPRPAAGRQADARPSSCGSSAARRRCSA